MEQALEDAKKLDHEQKEPQRKRTRLIFRSRTQTNEKPVLPLEYFTKDVNQNSSIPWPSIFPTTDTIAVPYPSILQSDQTSSNSNSSLFENYTKSSTNVQQQVSKQDRSPVVLDVPTTINDYNTSTLTNKVSLLPSLSASDINTTTSTDNQLYSQVSSISQSTGMSTSKTIKTTKTPTSPIPAPTSTPNKLPSQDENKNGNDIRVHDKDTSMETDFTHTTVTDNNNNNNNNHDDNTSDSHDDDRATLAIGKQGQVNSSRKMEKVNSSKEETTTAIDIISLVSPKSTTSEKMDTTEDNDGYMYLDINDSDDSILFMDAASDLASQHSTVSTTNSPESSTSDDHINAARHDIQSNTNDELPTIPINALSHNEDPIYIDPHFVKILKPHQVEGIQFMWKQLIEENNGCVLAHCMGLGKTLQVVVLVTTLFQEIEKKNLNIPNDLIHKRILILAPLITLSNWMNEFDLWIPPTQSSNLSHIFNFADIFNVNEDRRVDFVRRWYNDGGIMLMNYDQFRILLTTSSRMDDYGVMLYKPSLVILDEAHRIKNPAASISQCVSKIQTLRRLCLTGYPLQNNLNEYYCMLNFAFPGLLGEVTVFKAIYQKPIESVYADSTLNVRRLAKFKLLELQLMTSDIIHRKDISILAQELPGKTEYYIQCRLTPMQYSTYMTFLEYPKLIRTIMTQLMLFRAICNHPAIYTRMLTNCNMISRHKAVGNINDDGDDLEPVDQDEYGAVRKYAKMLPRDWQKYGFTEEDVKHLDNSHKVQLVLAISKLCRSKKEKLVIVSHSLVCLDFLEEILEKEEFNISKIDGRIKQRQPIIDKFNDDPACEIMLLSARAGGIGVNITGANRVILMDSDWNPSHDEQSIARLYRFGQKNHVYVYRLLTYSTVESTVNTLAQQKRGLSGRVVDNKKGKLQEETATRSYYRTPEKDPVCQVTDQQINELDDKILQQVLQTWKASVVAMNVEKTNHGTSSSLDPMDDHVQPSDSDLADMRRTARFTRANAKSYHQVLLHSFSS